MARVPVHRLHRQELLRAAVGLYKCVLFYYKGFLLPDAAWEQNELLLLYKLNAVYPSKAEIA
jgi:hypothetical protein